uniref:Serine hydroxymethyltransferase n=1 Tax=Eufriesea mexicana TaxID=516756 RepID=A0A310SHN7_9HYME
MQTGSSTQPRCGAPLVVGSLVASNPGSAKCSTDPELQSLDKNVCGPAYASCALYITPGPSFGPRVVFYFPPTSHIYGAFPNPPPGDSSDGRLATPYEKINAINYIWGNKIPFLGLYLGMQYNVTNTKEVIKLQTNCFVIAIGNDRTAYEFKQPITKFLHIEGNQFLNLGTNSSEPVCGTGIGISIDANSVNGVRCVLCYEEETVRLAGLHNDSNVLALGARIISPYKPVELVQLFLNAKTSAKKGHQLRVSQTQIILLLRKGCRKMNKFFNAGLDPELKEVLKGTILSNKCAEGYSGKVYYNGCENVDKSENLAIDCFKQLITCNHKPGQCKEGNFHANVPPHSCSQADAEAYAAI